MAPLTAKPMFDALDCARLRLPPEAADLAEALILTAARAAYEAGRPPTSGRPRWELCEPAWRAACCRDMAAALCAAQAAGYRIQAQAAARG